MSFLIKYKPLFKVNIWHNYFLDKGTDTFNNSMNIEQRQKQIELFNLKSILSILPTKTTAQTLTDHQLLMRLTNSGFMVLAKVENDNITPFVTLGGELNFSFLLQIKDPLFYNYSNLEMANSNKLYYLSNRRPGLESPNFPRLRPEGNNAKLDNDFILSAGNQVKELSLLSVPEKNNLLALIRIYINGDNNNLSVVTNQGKLKDPFQVFEIRIDNRKTTWRYIFRTDQQVKGGDDVKKEGASSKILVTKNDKPLTQNGFISVELGGVELPNPGNHIVKPDNSNNKYYSEIYM